jgi:hypothetical protein
MRLTDEMIRAGHDAYEAKAREMGHVSGSPVPWDEVPEPYRSCTVAAYEAVLAALADGGAVEAQDQRITCPWCHRLVSGVEPHPCVPVSGRVVEGDEDRLREQLENDPSWLRSDRDSWKQLAHLSRERAEAAEDRVGELEAALREAHRQLSRYEFKGGKQVGRAMMTMEKVLPALSAAGEGRCNAGNCVRVFGHDGLCDPGLPAAGEAGEPADDDYETRALSTKTGRLEAQARRSAGEAKPEPVRDVCKRYARFPTDEPPYCTCPGSSCREDDEGGER